MDTKKRLAFDAHSEPIPLLSLLFSSFYFPYEAGREIVPSLNPHRSLGSMKHMEEDTAKEYCKILYYSP
jgi:hypothetical protein